MPGLPTFTVGFDREGYSEIDLAAATATALGVKSMPYVITAEIYVANYGSNTISVVNTATRVVATVTLASGSHPACFGQFIQPASIPMTSIYTTPQGRLTLTSNTAVMTADATLQPASITRRIRAIL